MRHPHRLGRNAMVALALLVLLAAGCRQDAEPVPSSGHPAVSPQAEPTAPPGAVPAEEPAVPVAPAPEPAAVLEPHGLEYVELLTPSVSPGAALPTVIALHGLGDRPDRFAPLFARFEMPLRVVVPQAPLDYHGGYSWFETEIAGGEVRRIDVAGIRESARRVALLARALVRDGGTVGRPMVTGFSQGGILSFALAIHHPEVISLSVPMAGTLPRELWPDGPVADAPRLVALHGQDDTLVPAADAGALVAHLAGLGMPSSMELFPMVEHRISAEMRSRLFALVREGVQGLREQVVSYWTSAM